MCCAIVINNTGFFFFFPCLIKLLLLPQRKEKEKIITWIWLNKYVACRFQLESLQLQTMLNPMLMRLIVKVKRGCSGGISNVFYVSIIWEPFWKLTQSGLFLHWQNTEKKGIFFFFAGNQVDFVKLWLNHMVGCFVGLWWPPKMTSSGYRYFYHYTVWHFDRFAVGKQWKKVDKWTFLHLGYGIEVLFESHVGNLAVGSCLLNSSEGQ